MIVSVLLAAWWLTADAPDHTLAVAWIGGAAVVLAGAIPGILAARRVGPRHPRGSVTDQIEDLRQDHAYDRLLLHAIAARVGLDPYRPESWPTATRRGGGRR